MDRPELVDTKQISAELEAEADNRRRQDREIALLELEIEQAWTDLSPSGDSFDVFGHDGHLLDQTASLAALDPQVPIGSRRGLRGIKWAIRKLTYWYVRFLTDQFNLFAGVLVRHLHNLESRLGRLETAAGLPNDQSVPAGLSMLDDPPDPSDEVVDQVAALAGSGPCLVASAGEGDLVQAIGDRGIRAHGVEQDPDRVLAGLHRGIDIQAGNVLAHLVAAVDGEFGTIVLTGIIENLPLRDLIGMINQASLKLKDAGQIIVAVADPASRSQIESELGSGLGISPITWRHLLERAGFDAWLEPCADSRISQIVVAHRAAGELSQIGTGAP